MRSCCSPRLVGGQQASEGRRAVLPRLASPDAVHQRFVYAVPGGQLRARLVARPNLCDLGLIQLGEDTASGDGDLLGTRNRAVCTLGRRLLALLPLRQGLAVFRVDAV